MRLCMSTRDVESIVEMFAQQSMNLNFNKVQAVIHQDGSATVYFDEELPEVEEDEVEGEETESSNEVTQVADTAPKRRRKRRTKEQLAAARALEGNAGVSGTVSEPVVDAKGTDTETQLELEVEPKGTVEEVIQSVEEDTPFTVEEVTTIPAEASKPVEVDEDDPFGEPMDPTPPASAKVDELNLFEDDDDPFAD